MDRMQEYPIPEPEPVDLTPRPPRGPVVTHLAAREPRPEGAERPRPPADPDWPAGNVVRGLD